MNFFEQWRSLSARIAQVVEIAFRYIDASAIASGNDHYGMSNSVFIPQLQALQGQLMGLASGLANGMPPNARARLKELLELGFQFYKSPSGPAGMVALATSLSVIRAEVDPLMRDDDGPRIHVAEQAFLHLQRLIVADPEVRQRWRVAFADGEVACERLGGAHLLHHGIYGVKSNAAGERTDLVLGTRLAITPKIQRSADAMALTEWKLVRDPRQLESVVGDARRQAIRYAAGSLAGFEISSVRFLVKLPRFRGRVGTNVHAASA